MKILLLTFSIYPSYQDGIVGIAKELINKGFDVWTCYDKNSKIINKDKKKGIAVPEKNGICKGLFNVVEIFSLIRWINKEQFDKIYFESVHIWNILIFLFCSISSFYSAIHDVTVHGGDKHAGILYKLYRFQCKRSQYIVVRNKSDIAVLSKNFNIEKDKIIFIPLNYPFPVRNNTAERNGKVLFFGRMNPYKGIDNILEISRLLPNVKFMLYGKSTEEVKEIVIKCQIQPNIEIHDEFIDYDDMGQIFENCDCVILPYKNASQSGVIIDAYRFSKPVVAFNVGAFKEEVVDGKTGYLVESGNNTAFADAIMAIENLREDEYRVISKNAYEFGYEYFSNTAAANAFIDMVQI